MTIFENFVAQGQGLVAQGQGLVAQGQGQRFRESEFNVQLNTYWSFHVYPAVGLGYGIDKPNTRNSNNST